MIHVIAGDCVDQMKQLHSATIDLVCADPPFGINYQYDVYKDNLKYDKYMAWSREWIGEVKRLLKPNGTFWLAIGDAFASDLDVLCRRELGFTRRSWVVQHFSFGVNCTNQFTPSHTHLFHYVMNPKDFTFNADAIRVPSMRSAKYGDKRAKSGGRLPNDVWVLDSKAAADSGDYFEQGSDTWFLSRVCGTFKERVAFHPCQQPLALLERIIKVSSNPGDTVLDPMAGSGTTLVAARNLGRNAIGIELSENYVEGIHTRLLETTCPAMSS